MRLTKYALLIAAASMFSACATDTGTGNEEEQVTGAMTNSLVVGLTAFDLETGLSWAVSPGDDFFLSSGAIDAGLTTVRTLRAATLIRKWGPVSGLAELVGTVVPTTGWSSDAVGAEIQVTISDGFWIETDAGNVYAIYVRIIETNVIFTFDWVLIS